MSDDLVERLKPCPFCGGEAELDTSQGYIAMVSRTLGYRAVVYCTRCGADQGFCYDDAPGTPHEDIVNQVVDDWNRRTDLRAEKAEEENKRLREALKRGLDALRARASRGGITSAEVFTSTDPLMDILARAAQEPNDG